MQEHNPTPNEKPTHLVYDDLLIALADYVFQEDKLFSDRTLAYQTAHYALLDSMGCLLLAQKIPQCLHLLGPIIPGTVVPSGSRVPGTRFELDPIKAAFDIGTCIRWLDYNDTWLAEEWGHPSDNVGGILAVADFISRDPSIIRHIKQLQNHSSSKSSTSFKRITMKEVFTAMIQAYEIQGVLALNHAFNRVGLDHVVLVKVATTAVVSKLLGLSKHQTMEALSNAWIDGQSLRTYRHAPNTGARKSWAAGDATSRGVRLAWMVMQGQQGYPTALSAPHWGFQEVLFKDKPLTLSRPLQSYVMENILFKVAYPAEFHAQTAVEAAFQLHPTVVNKISEIEKIEIFTQESAIRIIHKEGPLHNYADRDHCLQYMVAVALLYGDLKPEYYSGVVAGDPNIDLLRSKMSVQENKQFSLDYLDPLKRAIPNAIQLFFKDGTSTPVVQIDYPMGHKLRRNEAVPILKEKYLAAISGHYLNKQAEELSSLWENSSKLLDQNVDEFIRAWVPQV